eukprot:228198-Pleurochrysis_carterae.AAC.1
MGAYYGIPVSAFQGVFASRLAHMWLHADLRLPFPLSLVGLQPAVCTHILLITLGRPVAWYSTIDIYASPACPGDPNYVQQDTYYVIKRARGTERITH